MYYDIITSENIDFITLKLNLEEDKHVIQRYSIPTLVQMSLELEI